MIGYTHQSILTKEGVGVVCRLR